MTKRRRKRGIFDPDYRTKEWRGTKLAPKNSTMGPSQLAFGIAFLLWGATFFIPQTKPIMRTTEGIALVTVAAFVFWIVLSILFLRLTRRQVPKQTEVDLSFEEPDEQNEPIQSLVTPPVDLPLATPTDFEHEVAMILNTLTPYKAIQVGRAGDGGVDIKVYQGEKLVGIVQCKRYGSGVALSPGAVRELYAVKVQFGVKTAYLVTTAKFTPATRKEAEKLGIKLIDGDKLDVMRQRAREKQRLQV